MRKSSSFVTLKYSCPGGGVIPSKGTILLNGESIIGGLVMPPLLLGTAVGSGLVNKFFKRP